MEHPRSTRGAQVTERGAHKIVVLMKIKRPLNPQTSLP